MKPEPWGEAIDAIVAAGPVGIRPVLVVPTPSGDRFAQRVAADLADAPWLIIACGRYEGIDARVFDYYRRVLDVQELSIGDYVLAGGEAAALVIAEAVIRLLPGVLGNSESAPDDSFAPDREGQLWKDPSTPSQLPGGTWTFLRCCFQATTVRSRNGARRPRSSEPLRGDQTCPSRVQCPCGTLEPR